MLRLPQGASRKDREIAAVACLGYQQPAVEDGRTMIRRAVLYETDDRLRGKRPRAAQPVAETPQQAACDAGAEVTAAPFRQGSVVSGTD